MTRRRMRPWLVAAGALVACALATAPRVVAQPTSDLVTARALFGEARNLVRQGKPAEACPMFEESYRLSNGIGALYNLADCWQQIGRTASAWAGFLDVAAQAAAKSESAREREARKRAANLEPRLSRLRIELAARPPGLIVKRNGAPLGDAQHGVAVPVDPGRHQLTAQAPEIDPWTQEVVIPDDGSTTTIRIPLTVPAPPPPPAAPAVGAQYRPRPVAPPPAAAPTTLAARAPDQVAREGRLTTLRTLGLVIAGAGLASTGVGTYFVIAMRDHQRSADGLCRRNGAECATADEAASYADAMTRAERAGTTAVVTLAAGGALVVGGAMLAWWAHDAIGAEPQVGLDLAPGKMAVTLRGHF